MNHIINTRRHYFICNWSNSYYFIFIICKSFIKSDIYLLFQTLLGNLKRSLHYQCILQNISARRILFIIDENTACIRKITLICVVFSYRVMFYFYFFLPSDLLISYRIKYIICMHEVERCLGKAICSKLTSQQSLYEYIYTYCNLPVCLSVHLTTKWPR